MARRVFASSWRPVAILNYVMSAFVIIVFVYYILQANIAAADGYRIKLLNDRLSSLREQNSGLVSGKSGNEDIAVISEFAQKKSMVPAKEVTYLFDRGNVALNQ